MFYTEIYHCLRRYIVIWQENLLSLRIKKGSIILT